jgi:diacylglycerol kinase family enzyme
VRFHETESRSHAGEKAVELVRNLAETTKNGRRVLVTAGGDGFHNDVCTALLLTVPDIMKDIVLFRLPMGTGNDNADAATVEEAFAILGSAVGTKKDTVIEARTARGAVHYAFNVVSFGLDAYVCELTNKMKNLAGPRAVYKIFADVGVLLYEKLWPLKPWSLTVSGPGGTEQRHGRFLLTVFGRKGDTRYGGGMKVLPGEENFLLVTPSVPHGKDAHQAAVLPRRPSRAPHCRDVRRRFGGTQP